MLALLALQLSLTAVPQHLHLLSDAPTTQVAQDDAPKLQVDPYRNGLGPTEVGAAILTVVLFDSTVAAAAYVGLLVGLFSGSPQAIYGTLIGLGIYTVVRPFLLAGVARWAAREPLAGSYLASVLLVGGVQAIAVLISYLSAMFAPALTVLGALVWFIASPLVASWGLHLDWSGKAGPPAKTAGSLHPAPPNDPRATSALTAAPALRFSF